MQLTDSFTLALTLTLALPLPALSPTLTLAMLVCGCPPLFLPTLNLPSSAVTFTMWEYAASSEGAVAAAGAVDEGEKVGGTSSGLRRLHSTKGATALTAMVWTISAVDTWGTYRDQIGR